MRAAARLVRQPHLDRLRALGCTGTALARLGEHHAPYGTMRIAARTGGFYEPCAAGQPALIVPVCWPEHHEGLITPLITLWPIIDLIAVRADYPANWLWRTGTAWALGGHLLEDWQGEPVPVVATPLDWLRAAGGAVCVLDWADNSPAWPILRRLPHIVASDDLLARRLAQAIDRTAPRPLISVGGRRHAA